MWLAPLDFLGNVNNIDILLQNRSLGAIVYKLLPASLHKKHEQKTKQHKIHDNMPHDLWATPDL